MKRKKKEDGHVSASDNMVMQLWSNIVRERAGFKCEYPGCKVHYTRVNAHHFFSRVLYAVRYDPLNGISLCHVHHAHGVDAAHSDPFFGNKIIESGVRDEAWLAELVRAKNKKVKNNQEFKNNWYEILSNWSEIAKKAGFPWKQ